jgi:radical SAM protein with 4Fe4S-binding SPASM domain
LAGAKLTSRFASAALLGMKMTIDKLSDDDDDDDDEDEDCENCEFLRTCENEAAIKYRKEHHIPKPKKNKNGGRKVDVN